MSRTIEAIRLGLVDGAIKSDRNGLPYYKNLWWHLDGKVIGYGDLSAEDVLNIALDLDEGETFVGFFEGSNQYDNQNGLIWMSQMDRVACIIRHQDINLALR